MPEETIIEKARRLFGDPVKLTRLLCAISDGLWTPEDAEALKAAKVQQAGG